MTDEQIARELGLPEAFVAWLPQNREIWLEFCALAKMARERGRDHWSARAILHVLRWNRMLRDSGDVFKINNHWSAPMSRLYNHLAGFTFFQEREPALAKKKPRPTG